MCVLQSLAEAFSSVIKSLICSIYVYYFFAFSYSSAAYLSIYSCFKRNCSNLASRSAICFSLRGEIGFSWACCC